MDPARRYPRFHARFPRLYVLLRDCLFRPLRRVWLALLSALPSRAGVGSLLAGPSLRLARLVAGAREILPWLRLWPALLPRGRVRAGGGDRHVVMLVVSNLRIDSRVERGARALAADGYAVTVIAPDISTPRLREAPPDWGPGIRFHPLPESTASFFYRFPWIAGTPLLDAALNYRPSAFHCHDLITMLAGLAAARTTGCACVCDFHEWWSEGVTWNADRKAWAPHPPWKRRWLRWLQGYVVHNADEVITVSGSIGAALGRGPFGGRRTVHLIRNIPSRDALVVRSHASLRDVLHIPPHRFLLLFQGGTGPSRLLEPVIDAVASMPEVVLVIRGPSLDLFGEGYRARARSAGAEDRVILLPPVPSREVVSAAVGADAGICTLPDLCPNYRLALPNKLFEYMAAGLPILAAHFPEIRGMVEGNGIGLCFDPHDARSIATQIRRFCHEPGLAARFRAAIPGVLERIEADREWDKLVALHRRIAARSR